MVLFDFRGHNIDMCCAMVDAMGQFLYRSTDSHGKMKILLGVMMKKRDRINDPRQQVKVMFFLGILDLVEKSVHPFKIDRVIDFSFSPLLLCTFNTYIKRKT